VTDERRKELIAKAADAGEDAFKLIIDACVKTVEDEDLSNEDAEKVIEYYMIPLNKVSKILVRARIYAAINERR
jgi:hypothetical protein